MTQEIQIVHGFNVEGLFWIVVFQYGKAEFRCQEIVCWLDTELGQFFVSNAENMAFHEMKFIIEQC